MFSCAEKNGPIFTVWRICCSCERLTDFLCSGCFQFGDVLYFQDHPEDWEFTDKSKRRRGLYFDVENVLIAHKSFFDTFSPFRFFQRHFGMGFCSYLIVSIHKKKEAWPFFDAHQHSQWVNIPNMHYFDLCTNTRHNVSNVMTSDKLGMPFFI